MASCWPRKYSVVWQQRATRGTKSNCGRQEDRRPTRFTAQVQRSGRRCRLATMLNARVVRMRLVSAVAVAVGGELIKEVNLKDIAQEVYG
jgi:hypothetical protein